MVMFNATGKANLTISAMNGTTWKNDSDSGYDLKFLDIKCGNDALNYTWIGDNCSETGNCSVFIENYSCNETGYEISKAITSGKHNLEFVFGNITKYAYNNATMTNLTFVSPTEANATTINRSWAQVNLTVDEPTLDTLKLNWNGTTYTIYDDSLILAMNFNNNSNIGENSSLYVDIS